MNPGRRPGRVFWLVTRLGLVLVGGTIALVAAEVLLRTVLADSNRYYLWMPNQTMTFRPYPVSCQGRAGGTRSVQPQGIRGSEWSSENVTLNVAAKRVLMRALAGASE